MSDVIVHSGWSPGLVGQVVAAHGVYYSGDWGFGAFFEAKVAAELGAFVARYDPAVDGLFRAERHGRFAGSLVIDGGDPDLPQGMAHLRWFIVTDEARGAGVGRSLLDAGLGFLRQSGFRTCYLTTFAGLHSARRLYERSGFVLVNEEEAESWGTRVREQRFVLDLVPE